MFLIDNAQEYIGKNPSQLVLSVILWTGRKVMENEHCITSKLKWYVVLHNVLINKTD